MAQSDMYRKRCLVVFTTLSLISSEMAIAGGGDARSLSHSEYRAPTILPTGQIEWKSFEYNGVSVSDERPDGLDHNYFPRKYGKYTVYTDEGWNDPYIVVGGEYYSIEEHCHIKEISNQDDLFIAECSAVSGEYGVIIDFVNKKTHKGEYHLAGYLNKNIMLIDFSTNTFSGFYSPKITILNLTENKKKGYLYFQPSGKYLKELNYSCGSSFYLGRIKNNSIVLSGGVSSSYCKLQFAINTSDMKGRYFVW